MLRHFRLIFLAIFTLVWASIYAQSSPVPDSSMIPEPVDSAYIEDDNNSTTAQPSRFEIDLNIEEVQNPEIIGDFYNNLKYDLSLDTDTIQEMTKEYVAYMRAHAAVRSIIYDVWKPIAPNDMPFLLQFKQNIFTGFKPVQPLIQFGF